MAEAQIERVVPLGRGMLTTGLAVWLRRNLVEKEVLTLSREPEMGHVEANS